MERKGRITTGIPGLDIVLDGGLVEGATVLVQGLPGAGKTTFRVTVHLSRGNPMPRARAHRQF